MPASPKSSRSLGAKRTIQRKSAPRTVTSTSNGEKVRWTFLTNHSHVIILLAQDPSMVLREVASRIGITERAVQRIIAELEQDGFIEREKVGRNNHYLIRTKKPLRHPIEAHRTLGDLLNLLQGRRPHSS
jgi:predicted DNA-binding transcriptional regulator